MLISARGARIVHWSGAFFAIQLSQPQPIANSEQFDDGEAEEEVEEVNLPNPNLPTRKLSHQDVNKEVEGPPSERSKQNKRRRELKEVQEQQVEEQQEEEATPPSKRSQRNKRRRKAKAEKKARAKEKEKGGKKSIGGGWDVCPSETPKQRQAIILEAAGERPQNLELAKQTGVYAAKGLYVPTKQDTAGNQW